MSASPDQILPHGRVLRYPFWERCNHWIAAGSYLYCLLTGLAFWSPWLLWIAVVLGGGQNARVLHPWAGLLFAYSTARMYGYWARDMHGTESDRAWWRALPLYVRNQDRSMPPAGRYNGGQKALFWSFVYGALALLLSGLLLWFPERIPWSLRGLRYLAVVLHPAAALFTIGNFMIHIYMSVFAEPGALRSAVRGDVSLEFAKRFHPEWYREIVAKHRPPGP